MQARLYTIHDSKAGVFNPPFLQNTHGEAERTFNKYVHDPKSMLSQYPEDYHLYYLGMYDDNSAKFELLPAPQHITSAIAVQASKRNEAVALAN